MAYSFPLIEENYSSTKSLISTITLLIANLVTIGFFISNNGSILQVLWIYWLQSVIIGIINLIRIINIQADLPTSIFKNFSAIFFAFHYGGFHFIYMFFLFAFSSPNVPFTVNGTYAGMITLGGNISLLAILTSGLFFAIHHGFSYINERSQFRKSVKPVDSAIAINNVFLMVRPYARIIPMHIVIIFAPIISLYYGNNYIFIIFMFLKTFVDLISYVKGISHLKVPNISQANQVRQTLNAP